MKKNVLMFLIGGVGYCAIELLWRGYTHWSMLLAGGICFVIFSLIAKVFFDDPLIVKAVLCGAAVTCVEFAFGVIFNIALKMNVWNYSDIPFNVLGQVCPKFSLMWILLAFAFVPLANFFNEVFDK